MQETDAAEQAARGPRGDDRRILNGIFWVLRSGAAQQLRLSIDVVYQVASPVG
jgi:hypothetical protein